MAILQDLPRFPLGGDFRAFVSIEQDAPPSFRQMGEAKVML